MAYIAHGKRLRDRRRAQPPCDPQPSDSQRAVRRRDRAAAPYVPAGRLQAPPRPSRRRLRRIYCRRAAPPLSPEVRTVSGARRLARPVPSLLVGPHRCSRTPSRSPFRSDRPVATREREDPRQTETKSKQRKRRNKMKIKVTSIYVDNQDKALRFYTEVLGFAKKADFSQGPYRWLTVASPEEPDGTELQLALNNNPAAKAYQQALFQQSQPAAMFFSDDVQAEYERINGRGAEFTMPPTDVTASKIAMLKDTCGNLIQVTQLKRW